MRTIVIVNLFLLAEMTCAARAIGLEVNWITQYCNETLQTANLASDPRHACATFPTR